MWRRRNLSVCLRVPFAAPKACSQQPCPHPALPGGKCQEHKAKAERDRGTAWQRGYTTRWYRATRMWIRADYMRNFCADPFKVHGPRLEPGTQVDHIIPHRGDTVLFWDFEHNLQVLCASCHSRKTMMGE